MRELHPAHVDLARRRGGDEGGAVFGQAGDGGFDILLDQVVDSGRLVIEVIESSP